MFNISLTELWLIIGVICFIIEFFATPNIGFLFFGFGALSNTIIIHNYPILLKEQITIFGLISLLWFIILWRPLKKYFYRNSNTKETNYSDMINKEVEVYSSIISSREIGQVKWSGVVMNALLEQNQQEAKAGDRIFIVKVQGNILICSKTRVLN
ncbi:NfeD family protein [Rickettsia endosymbiont of Halotydeus destructor]|uniref:NfeD family protein n=1 Tax=Rickettsia endosymbiont of Halotydeus destructor TaxID=2996754 RepID=UPI003BB1D58D